MNHTIWNTFTTCKYIIIFVCKCGIFTNANIRNIVLVETLHFITSHSHLSPSAKAYHKHKTTSTQRAYPDVTRLHLQSTTEQKSPELEGYSAAFRLTLLKEKIGDRLTLLKEKTGDFFTSRTLVRG